MMCEECSGPIARGTLRDPGQSWDPGVRERRGEGRAGEGKAGRFCSVWPAFPHSSVYWGNLCL